MHILFMPASYPPVLGGLQTTVHTLARQLVISGHRVVVVTNHYPRALPQRETLDGVDVRRWMLIAPNRDYLRQGRPDLFAAACTALPLGLARLARLVEEFQPDVVNVHFPDGQVPFVIWLRRHFAFRLVVSLHGDDIDRWFPDRAAISASPKLAQLRSLLEASDAITACSQFLLDRAIRIAPAVAAKGCVIHNGIDPARFATPTAYHHPRPYVLAFGRLTYKKGFDLLLDAFACVADRYPSVDLILAGDGQMRDQLHGQARRLGIAERVFFFGRASQQEIVWLINGCRFAVIPSRQEPFGIAALEGMAAGKPLLATRVGGLPEIVQQPLNYLVEPTVDALKEGLEYFLGRGNDAGSPLLMNQNFARKFSWNKTLDTYAQVLETKT